jgi:hypothetical protein
MARNKRKPSKKQPKRPRQARSSKKKMKSKRPAVNLTKPVVDYLKLVSDPCMGPLVRSVGHVHPGAVTERLRTTFTSGYRWNGTATVAVDLSTSGYIVWFPSYHNDGLTPSGVPSAAYSPGNLYLFTSTTPGTAPVNATATPAGQCNNSTGMDVLISGNFLEDPAQPQLSGTSPFVRATCLSACLQLDYIGALSAISGQVACVQNYSLASFIQNTNASGGAIPAFPSVDQVFAHAAERSRLHPEGAEVIWRPTEDSSIPRTAGARDQSFQQTDLVLDAPFWVGAVGADYTRVCATNPNEVYGMCLAWKGVPAGSLSINAVKVVDFELAARNGQIEEIRTSVPPSEPSTTIDSVINVLDDVAPGWQSNLRDMASEAAHGAAVNVGRLLREVWSGGKPAQAKAGLRGMIGGMGHMSLMDR